MLAHRRVIEPSYPGVVNVGEIRSDQVNLLGGCLGGAPDSVGLFFAIFRGSILDLWDRAKELRIVLEAEQVAHEGSDSGGFNKSGDER